MGKSRLSAVLVRFPAPTVYMAGLTGFCEDFSRNVQPKAELCTDAAVMKGCCDTAGHQFIGHPFRPGVKGRAKGKQKKTTFPQKMVKNICATIWEQIAGSQRASFPRYAMIHTSHTAHTAHGPTAKRDKTNHERDGRGETAKATSLPWQTMPLARKTRIR